MPIMIVPSQLTLFAALASLTLMGIAANATATAATSLRFDFGAGPLEPGYTRVEPDTNYPGEEGWGFDLGSRVQTVLREGGSALQSDLITSEEPFFFSVQLPEGNHRVTVTFGGEVQGSTNTVKAESRRLMLERVVTAPGEFVTRSFTVNIRTPRISEDRSVRLKSREEGVLHWDDKLTLEFNGSHPAICALEILPETNAVTVFLLGDSTVTDQPDEPWNSWGQMLTRFFGPEVAVANYAESGESIKSSLGARRVEKVFSVIKPGDYLFVQFGHNDMKDKSTNALATYKANLRKLVAQAKEFGATPVLVTSMERKAGVNGETLMEYPQTVRDVAWEEHVALIDLQHMSLQLYRALGGDLGAAFQDGTHHNAYGSYLLAKCVARGILENELPLAEFLVNDMPAFNPKRPDPVGSFDVPPSPGFSRVKPEGN